MRDVQVSNHFALFAIIMLAESFCVGGWVSAQTPLRQPPHVQLVEAAEAQANLIAAQSARHTADAEALSQLAAKNNEFAQRVSNIIVNQSEFREYWDRKKERLLYDRLISELQIENRQMIEEARRLSLMAQYEALFKPERMVMAKLKGGPQNLMLALLSEKTEISYASELPLVLGDADGRAFALPDRVLDAIHVSSPTLRGPRKTFTLSEPVAIDLSWWPTLLQREVFAQQRDRITEIRQQLVASVTSDAPLDLSVMDDLEKQLTQLTTAFYRQHPPGQRRDLTTRQMLLIFQSEDFLRQLDSQTTAILLDASASPVQGRPFDREQDGKHVGTLVRWMLDNNLRFEPPTPQDAGHYVTLFDLMKDYCVACGIAPTEEWVEAATWELDRNWAD